MRLGREYWELLFTDVGRVVTNPLTLRSAVGWVGEFDPVDILGWGEEEWG